MPVVGNVGDLPSSSPPGQLCVCVCDCNSFGIDAYTWGTYVLMSSFCGVLVMYASLSVSNSLLFCLGRTRQTEAIYSVHVTCDVTAVFLEQASQR